MYLMHKIWAAQLRGCVCVLFFFIEYVFVYLSNHLICPKLSIYVSLFKQKNSSAFAPVKFGASINWVSVIFYAKQTYENMRKLV